MKRNFLTTQRSHTEKCCVKGTSGVHKCVCVHSRKVTWKNIKEILLYVNVFTFKESHSEKHCVMGIL